ncbi:hypothetical protein SDC9_210516 [bioreactor metagenome]|uniref:Uncharacterized protein n=1 Tax=bioreactor metagenome TaxID=1076179 RepID=A0A645JU23_9ZZZZ
MPEIHTVAGNPSKQSMRHHFRLLVYLLEHKVRIIAPVGHRSFPVQMQGFLFMFVSVKVVENTAAF